jgi:predicted 2-oxoglutarate/Fe(II)-dependent dioxygenase YbiX
METPNLEDTNYFVKEIMNDDIIRYILQKNLEINDSNIVNSVNNGISELLHNNFEFESFAIPSGEYKSVISKMEETGYYGPHIDSWTNGDFSTTVFLNNSDEYEGGELCLYLGGDNEIKIKLDAGWAVTYCTGTLHRVNQVKSGTRYVSVIWSKSILKSNFMRQIYHDLSNIENNLSNNYNLNSNSFYVSDCYSSTKDPIFCIKNLKEQILRNNSIY